MSLGHECARHLRGEASRHGPRASIFLTHARCLPTKVDAAGPVLEHVQSVAQRQRGDALLPLLSLLNHSCAPSARVALQGTQARLVATRCVVARLVATRCIVARARVSLTTAFPMLAGQWPWVTRCASATGQPSPHSPAEPRGDSSFCCDISSPAPARRAARVRAVVRAAMLAGWPRNCCVSRHVAACWRRRVRVHAVVWATELRLTDAGVSRAPHAKSRVHPMRAADVAG